MLLLTGASSGAALALLWRLLTLWRLGRYEGVSAQEWSVCRYSIVLCFCELVGREKGKSIFQGQCKAATFARTVNRLSGKYPVSPL